MPMFWIGFGIFAIISTVLNNQVNTNENNCCTCLDCPKCDICCDCNNPYLNKYKHNFAWLYALLKLCLYGISKGNLPFAHRYWICQ